MFDLPVLTLEQRKEYNHFRKYLIKNGFMMMQESIYVKMVLNAVAGNAIKANVKLNAPSEGYVQILTVTEQQFARIEYIVGNTRSEILNDNKRLVIL